ncbi:MAG: hypothetical protein ACMUHM_08895 [Thermoplasmatota archaeon]
MKGYRVRITGSLLAVMICMFWLHFVIGSSDAQSQTIIPSGPDEIDMGSTFLINITNTEGRIAIEARYPGPERSWVFEDYERRGDIKTFQLPAVYCGTNITYRSLIWEEERENGSWAPSSVWQLISIVGWVDSDGDTLSDQWEALHDLSTDDPNEDEDQDGLILLEEMYHLTDPAKVDSDGDSMDDHWEADHGTLPFRNDPNNDPDGDGWSNIMEKTRETEPRDPADHPDEPRITPWYWIVIITGVLLLILGYFVKQLFNKKKLEDDMEDFDNRTLRRSSHSHRDNSGKV